MICACRILSFKRTTLLKPVSRKVKQQSDIFFQFLFCDNDSLCCTFAQTDMRRQSTRRTDGHAQTKGETVTVEEFASDDYVTCISCEEIIAKTCPDYEPENPVTQDDDTSTGTGNTDMCLQNIIIEAGLVAGKSKTKCM